MAIEMNTQFGDLPDFTHPTIIDAVLRELDHPPRAQRTSPVQQNTLGSARPRSVSCSVCSRRVLPAQLLTHMQNDHGGEVFNRTSSGLPRGIWFSSPSPVRRTR